MNFGPEHIDELRVVQQVHDNAREETGDCVNCYGHEVELTVHDVKFIRLAALLGVLLGPDQTAPKALGRVLLAEVEDVVLAGPLLNKPLDLKVLLPDLSRRGQKPVRDRP